MNVMLFCIVCFQTFSFSSQQDSADEVLAYPYKVDGFARSKRDCVRYAYGNKTSVTFIAHGRQKTDSDSSKITSPEVLRLPIVESYQSTITVNPNTYYERNIFIHVAYINNPDKTVSVYEPLHDGTCKPENLTRTTVEESAKYRHCLLATNAGFFNTKTGSCYGNIVSDGRLVQDSQGIQNVHFGITRDGHLFFGYLTEIDVVKDDFIQLVGGVIWVLKDGEPYVDESIAVGCRDTEETGTLQKFASVISARTLVGHDEKGRVIILQIEGKTDKFGANLYEAATILKDLGAINAINLDGGGSSTLVINNTLANNPSDNCGKYNCARRVTTILCVHEPLCKNRDCGGHGACDLGKCHCNGNWKGENCDTLYCPDDCSGHGTCIEVGCACYPGYHGENCSSSCADGFYGDNCVQQCHCENNASCNSVTGNCQCLPGFTGTFCQFRCALGYYGNRCSEECACIDTCLCDPVTGVCNYTFAQDDYVHGSCYEKKLQHKRDIEFDMLQQYKRAIITVIVSTTVAFLSLIVNCILICKYCSRCGRKKKGSKRKHMYARACNGRKIEFQGEKHSSTSAASTEEEQETSLVERQSLLPS